MSTIDRNPFLHTLSVANDPPPVNEPPPSSGGTGSASNAEIANAR